MAQTAELLVRDIMRRDVPLASPATPVGELARLMADNGVPGIPVVDERRLVGIVTEGDLIQREADVDIPSVATIFDAVIIADAGTPFEEELRHVLATTAADLMSSPVFSIRDVATLSELATLMTQEQINPVPVVDESRQIVGLATRSALVATIARLEAERQ